MKVLTGTKAMLACVVVAAVCSAVAANLPNPIDGGYTYYYGRTEGNTTDNPDNVYGRLPMSLRDFTPTPGTTNMMYLTCEDEFWLAENWKFTGIGNYDQEKTGSGNVEEWSNILTYDNTGEHCRFNAYNGMAVDVVGRWINAYILNCHFKFTGGGGALLQTIFVGRGDAYYRMPRSDTYYVVPNTQLWFFRNNNFDRSDFLDNPWVDDGGNALPRGYHEGNGWTYRYDGSWYDKFTITASAGSTIHLRSQNGCRDVTVHVVPTTFRYDELRVRYNVTEPGGTETRSLRQILVTQGRSIPDCGIDTVKASDGRVTCEMKGNDCELTAHGPFADDCEVTVTFKDGNVLLLRIVSMPGKISQACCSAKMPKLVTTDFKNLLTDASGTLREGLVWEDYPGCANAPVGYSYVKRTLNCIYYKGAFYTPCIAGVKRITLIDEPGPRGQLQCFGSNQKLVGWLEDANGRKVINPSICIGNSGHASRLYWRFGDGPDNTIYNNCHPVYLDRYVGTKVDYVEGHFQGMLSDEYGYFTFYLPANSSAGGQAWDEFAVFQVSDSKEIRVHKTVEGSGGEDLTFEFQAVYGDLSGKTVTNIFNVGRFNDWEHVFVAGTNAAVTVTELSTGKFTTTVRRLPDGPVISGQTIGDDGIIDNSSFEFVNTMRPDQIRLWITDHFDSGDGKVHLAFDPGLGTDPKIVGSWAKYARENNIVLCRSSINEAQLETAPLEPVLGFRDGHGTNDAAKGWVWVTIDTSHVHFGNIRLWKLYINNTPCYCDGLIRSAAAVTDVQRTDLGNGLYAYEFFGVRNEIGLSMCAPATLTRILMVGGGGAGGGVIGGGGGGGQVVDNLFENGGISLEPSDAVFVKVGAGGLPPAQEPSTDIESPVWKENGGNGQSSSAVIGNRTFVAIGGGGGASFSSTSVSNEGASGGGAAGVNGATTGGQPKDSSTGHAGGDCTNASYPGGGGGAETAGGNGDPDLGHAGAGGAGKACGLLGEICGAGGGGGSSTQSSVAGGEHAGRGGTAAGDETSFGGAGEDGYGAGGGGGGYAYINSQSIGYPGGRGGNGKVVLIFQTPRVEQ